MTAYHKAAKGKRGQQNVAEFEYRLEDNLVQLQDQLSQGTYRPGTYHHFFIHEPKRRLISAAPFRDRVVHHALCSQLEPVFEKSFIDDSYANRVGKGTHRALDRCQRLSRRFRFVLQCDVRQFFPAIDHQILKNAIEQKVFDRRVRDLISIILGVGEDILTEQYEMRYFAGDDLFAAMRPRGLPIGNLTSQFWANVYLNSFDHFVKRELRAPGYLRYVDDFMMFSNSKKELWDWLVLVKKRLAKLRLIIHDGSHPRPVTEGISFLGFRVFPKYRRLKRRKGVHFQRKLARLQEEVDAGMLEKTKLKASIQGWINHVRYANTVGLRKSILNR